MIFKEEFEMFASCLANSAEEEADIMAYWPDDDKPHASLFPIVSDMKTHGEHRLAQSLNTWFANDPGQPDNTGAVWFLV